MKVVTLFLLFFLSSTLYADLNVTESNSSIELDANKKKDLAKIRENVKYINGELKNIDDYLAHDIMYAKYNNHQTFINIENELSQINKEIEHAKKVLNSKKVAELEVQKKSLQNQLSLLDDFKTPPFLNLTKPDDLDEPPVVDSPFSIINALTYIKHLKAQKDEYNKELSSLRELINKLQEKERYLLDIKNIFGTEYKKDDLDEVRKEIKEIQRAYEIASATNKLYNKKVEDSTRNITSLVKEQIKRLINISLIILSIFLLSFLFKYFAKKTISDNERFYMANKFINFTNLFLVAMVLLFAFIENATYLVTVLGFASAGIAIAMKDLFMSMLGWFVIVFGGSFHVGDRIKVYKGSKSYVGDIVDISFLRMTILEDITYTTYVENRRSGRIVFVPNNYIFTELLANYTHGKIKTVWDGIDITITFDSNHKKAAHIVKEVVRKYSKGYTDISRKQLNQLRNRYSLKNINVEPRIYTFIEKYGMTVSCWYMTNSYAALTLRSNMSAVIIDELNAQDDIKIAYETHVVNIKKDEKMNPNKEDGETESLS